MSVFGVVLVRVQSKCAKIRTGITPNTDSFYTVLSARIFGESTRNAFWYYVKNGHTEWEGTFFKTYHKYWSLVNVKSVFKGTWKRDINMESPDSSNIGRFTEFMHKFAR